MRAQSQLDWREGVDSLKYTMKPRAGQCEPEGPRRGGRGLTGDGLDQIVYLALPRWPVLVLQVHQAARLSHLIPP